MNIMRKSVVIIMALTLITNSFAAVVSDNDGSAFITKAEFDSLKNTFQSQIDQYNMSIDNKIDTAIAQYLSGIKVETSKVANTAFVLDGVDNKIVFIGTKKDKNNMNNMFSTQDNICNVICGTYATNAYYIQDVYDTYVFEAHYDKDFANRNNYAFILDADGRVSTSKQDIFMYGSRVYTAYSTYHSQNGIIWGEVKQELALPTALSNANDAYITTTEAKGYGFRRVAMTWTPGPDEWATIETLWTLYSDNGNPNGFSGVTYYDKYQKIWRSDLETKTLTDLIKTCNISITGTDVKPNIHWPTGSDYKIKSFSKEWGSIDTVKEAVSTLEDYTYVYRNRSVSGGHSARAKSGEPAGSPPYSFDAEVRGYGLEFVYDEKAVNDVYYLNTSKAWKENIGYSGGIPICKTDKKGYATITLQVDGEVEIAFQNEQNNNFPSATDKRFKKFKIKVNGSSGDYQEQTSSVVLTAGTYDFKVDLNENEKLFLTAAMGNIDGEITFIQVGDAKVISEQ